MIKEIELDIEVSRASGVIASELDDEIVMMSIEQGEYYGLGQIGSKIWLLIEQPKKVKELIKLLTEKYDVEDKQCQHDVCSFLTQLHEKGLIVCAS